MPWAKKHFQVFDGFAVETEAIDVDLAQARVRCSSLEKYR